MPNSLHTLITLVLVFLNLFAQTTAVPTWNTWSKSLTHAVDVATVVNSSIKTGSPTSSSISTKTWHPSVHTSAAANRGDRPDSDSNDDNKNGPALVSSPLGRVEVHNRCPFDVGSNIVHAPRTEGEVPEEVTGVLGRFVVPTEKESKSGNKTVSGGVIMSHPFLHDPGVGVSWKLSRGHGSGPVQFEWTWVPDQERVYWDLSMIDASTNTKRSLIARTDPATHVNDTAWTPTPSADQAHVDGVPLVHHALAPHGITITPVVDGQNVTRARGGGHCTPIVCPRGAAGCRAAYNAWNDWQAQRDCGERVTLKVVLCA